MKKKKKKVKLSSWRNVCVLKDLTQIQIFQHQAKNGLAGLKFFLSSESTSDEKLRILINFVSPTVYEYISNLLTFEN